MAPWTSTINVPGNNPVPETGIPLIKEVLATGNTTFGEPTVKGGIDKVTAEVAGDVVKPETGRDKLSLTFVFEASKPANTIEVIVVPG